MRDKIKLPESWGLSEQQDIVIGGLIDFAGSYTSAGEFCMEIYDEDCGGPAPAKLRVLIQRCRTIIDNYSEGKIAVLVKRNSGWKLTKRDAFKMKKIIAQYT